MKQEWAIVGVGSYAGSWVAYVHDRCGNPVRIEITALWEKCHVDSDVFIQEKFKTAWITIFRGSQKIEMYFSGKKKLCVKKYAKWVRRAVYTALKQPFNPEIGGSVLIKAHYYVKNFGGKRFNSSR